MKNRGRSSKNKYGRNRENNNREDTTLTQLNDLVKALNDIGWSYYDNIGNNRESRDKKPETFINFLLSNPNFIEEIKRAREGLSGILSMVETKLD